MQALFLDSQQLSSTVKIGQFPPLFSVLTATKTLTNVCWCGCCAAFCIWISHWSVLTSMFETTLWSRLGSYWLALLFILLSFFNGMILFSLWSYPILLFRNLVYVHCWMTTRRQKSLKTSRSFHHWTPVQDRPQWCTDMEILQLDWIRNFFMNSTSNPYTKI